MFFILSPQDLRAPSADRRETLPRKFEFYNASPKIRAPSGKKIILGKIWVDFTQLPSLIANISGTSQDIQNRENKWSRTIPPAFGERSPVYFGPLSKKYQCKFGPTQVNFFRETIFRPLGVLAPEIFTLSSRVWSRLAIAHTTNRNGDPQKFKGEHLKFALKFNMCAPITFAVVDVTSLNFTRGSARDRRDNVCTSF